MKILVFQVFVVLLFSSIEGVASPNIPNRNYIDFSDPRSCLEYQGYNRGNGGMTLQFRNRCDFNIYAVACVTYPNGKQETKSSTSRIPKRGSWNTTFFEGTYPKSVDWSAALYPSQAPLSCS